MVLISAKNVQKKYKKALQDKVERVDRAGSMYRVVIHNFV